MGSDLPGWALDLIRVGAVLVGAFVINRIVHRIIRRTVRRIIGEEVDLEDIREKRAETLGAVLQALSTAVIWAMALLVSLSQAGINIAPLIAAAGIGGIAIGFGAQTLVGDVISGFFILLEDQYHVADVIRVGGVSGAVEKITLRTTVLRDLQGERHVIPNGEVRVSSNLTQGFSRYVIDLPVPYDEDVDRVVDVVSRVAEDMRSEPDFQTIMLGPLTVLGVDEFGPSEILVKVYVETMPGKQWVVGRELRKRIKNAYDIAGISIPFPHREVIIKDGGGEPARLPIPGSRELGERSAGPSRGPGAQAGAQD